MIPSYIYAKFSFVETHAMNDFTSPFSRPLQSTGTSPPVIPPADDSDTGRGPVGTLSH